MPPPPPPPGPPPSCGGNTLSYAQKKAQELTRQMDQLSVDANKVASMPLSEEERNVLEEKNTEAAGTGK